MPDMPPDATVTMHALRDDDWLNHVSYVTRPNNNQFQMKYFPGCRRASIHSMSAADDGAEVNRVLDEANRDQAVLGLATQVSSPAADADADAAEAGVAAPLVGRARPTRACAARKRSREPHAEPPSDAEPATFGLERQSGKTQRDYFRESIVARMKSVLSGDELERKVAEFTEYVTSLRAAPTQPGNDLTLWQLWQIAGQAAASDHALSMAELDGELDPASRAMALGILVANLEAATRDAAADTSHAAIQRLERAVGACTEQLMPNSSGGAICAEASALVASSGLSDRLEMALASAAMVFSRRDELGTVERSGRAVLDWLRGCAAVDSLDTLEDVQAALTSAAAWRDSFERSKSTLNTAALKELSDAVVTAELRAEERALELTLSRSAAEGGGLLRTHIQAYRALLTRVLDAERNQRQLWHRCAAVDERLVEKERELAQAREQLRSLSASRMCAAAHARSLRLSFETRLHAWLSRAPTCAHPRARPCALPRPLAIFPPPAGKSRGAKQTTSSSAAPRPTTTSATPPTTDGGAPRPRLSPCSPAGLRRASHTRRPPCATRKRTGARCSPGSRARSSSRSSSRWRRAPTHPQSLTVSAARSPASLAPRSPSPSRPRRRGASSCA
jgi:hypothetical protein